MTISHSIFTNPRARAVPLLDGAVVHRCVVRLRRIQRWILPGVRQMVPVCASRHGRSPHPRSAGACQHNVVRSPLPAATATPAVEKLWHPARAPAPRLGAAPAFGVGSAASASGTAARATHHATACGGPAGAFLPLIRLRQLPRPSASGRRSGRDLTPQNDARRATGGGLAVEW